MTEFLPPTVTHCIQAVAQVTKVRYEAILGAQRGRWISRPRQVAMWVASRTTRKSLPQIGAVMDRDHTTIMHGIRQVEFWREQGDKNIIEWSDAAMRRVLADPRQPEMAL